MLQVAPSTYDARRRRPPGAARRTGWWPSTRPAGCASRYAGGLELFGQLGDPLGTALCLAGLAALAVEATPPQTERAARLAAVAAVLQGAPAAGKQHAPRELRAEYDRAAGAVRAALNGNARAQRAWREARALAPAQAMRWAVEHGCT